MKIHHVGYFVDDINASAVEFQNIGFSTLNDVVEDTARKINILFLENNGYIIELIQPMSDISPFYGLRKRYRNSPYHICYVTDNLIKEIEKMVNLCGYVLFLPPSPAPAISGCPNVAFLMNKHIGIIELVELK